MPKAATKNTVYGGYVEHIVIELSRAGQLSMTVNDIAEAASLKITPNLRRQIHRLCREGILQYATGYHRLRGRHQLYYSNIIEDAPF